MIKIFKRDYADDEIKMFEFLRKVRLFWNLTNKELELFIPIMYLRSYGVNEAIFFSGDPSQALYIVKKGSVSLTIDIDDKFEDLMKLRQTHAFGDNSLIENTKRIYNAVCTTDKTEVYVLPHINMMEIFNNHPEVKAKVMTNMAETYNTYTKNLFKVYKSSFGFFELTKVYKDQV
ncbi:Crp/Fnr family transcriptional regulator [Reichenbachiella versicolor]|uniref:Crp/Fnr family transcriptional regulator n=1 Tax=Reichenbachiella versicolor TaxID=1821036 RepID=UPI000D6EAE6E|nr:cyclic nucleotide-binding domain-containing protein [Reichenbachiella versicolor]